MGVDLVSVNSPNETSFNWTAWKFLLDTAKQYGWAPMGTILEFPYQHKSAVKGKKLDAIAKERTKLRIQKFCEEWDGSYASNENQLVIEDDTRNILRSLTKAINAPEFVQEIASDQRDVLIQFLGFLKNEAFRIG